MALVVKHQVAVAVGKGDFERGLDVQPRAPSRILLRRVGVGDVEGSPLAASARPVETDRWPRAARPNRAAAIRRAD